MLVVTVWDDQFTTLLTSDSRHNGVHFFKISSSKSAPRPSGFNTFDVEMCFAPQRRALRTSQLPKVLRTWCALYIFTSKCASRPSGFLLPFSSLTLPTSAFSYVHHVGSLTSKLPSRNDKCDWICLIILAPPCGARGVGLNPWKIKFNQEPQPGGATNSVEFRN